VTLAVSVTAASYSHLSQEPDELPHPPIDPHEPPPDPNVSLLNGFPVGLEGLRASRM